MAMFNITYVGAFAMARCVAAPIDLTNKPRRRLEAIVRRHSAPQSLVMRARIILLGAADPLLLTTILAKLLDNACKYGLPPEPIQLSLTREGRRVRLVIRNRCVPPVAANPATLLERGVRGANSAACPGHGLGLNLASHLARDLGGELQVHLTPDADFEAWLDLPAWPESGSATP